MEGDDQRAYRRQKNDHIICKSGKLTENFLYMNASLESSRSVIINQDDDFLLLRYCLPLSIIWNQNRCLTAICISTMIHPDRKSGSGKNCGRKGRRKYCTSKMLSVSLPIPSAGALSLVLTRFFDFSGGEFYFEQFPGGPAKPSVRSSACLHTPRLSDWSRTDGRQKIV